MTSPFLFRTSSHLRDPSHSHHLQHPHSTPYTHLTMSAFTKSLKELRVHFCQTSPASNGIRQFVASNYTAVKAANPNLPILIREAKGAEAKIFARFEHGQEKKIVLDGLSAKEIEAKLATLVK
ncbi:MAG: thioredoxin-like protein [Linnemannia gamsii]|nr:MAG: thioredoxin-like protein [Linnemannia gamsii]